MATSTFFSWSLWKKVAAATLVWVSLGFVAVYSAAPQESPAAAPQESPAAAPQESLAAALQEAPAGTIELSGGSVAAGVGYTWGSGVLVFQGKKYDLDVNGLSVLHVGASGYTASGTVYNLKSLSDFNGVYTSVSPRSSLVEGPSTITMKNPHGVLIQMAATHTGMAFSLGPNGLTITVKE
jgi:hypothetical protein